MKITNACPSCGRRWTTDLPEIYCTCNKSKPPVVSSWFTEDDLVVAEQGELFT